MQLAFGDTATDRSMREKVQWAENQERAARDRLAQAERASSFWRELYEHFSQGNAASVLLVVKRAGDYVRQLEQSRDPIVATLTQIRAEAEERARAGAQEFGRKFPEEARRAGIAIDPNSRHPHYGFHGGFFQLEADERNLIAKLRPRDGEEIVLGLDVKPIVGRIVSEIERLFNREFNGPSLLRSIYTAYLATLRVEKREEGEEVPLRRITNRLAKNLNRFAADEFNVDLARLVRSGEVTTQGSKMHLNHTRNTRQGMLLHGLEEGGYVGFISFKKEGRS